MGDARAVILMAAETPCIKYLFVTLIEISVLVYHYDGALLMTVDIIICLDVIGSLFQVSSFLFAANS